MQTASEEQVALGEYAALYPVVKALKENVDAHARLIGSANTEELLGKSLDAGHIGIIDYYRELAWYYETYDVFLSTERDYYLGLLELNRYGM